MRSSGFALRGLATRLPLILMLALLVTLWIAGGSSRADVVGQVITRFAAWCVLIAAVLLLPKAHFRYPGKIGWFLLAAAVLVLAQLVPLPPNVWTTLPGRAMFEAAARIVGRVEVWRPITISPGATVNALSALIVPAVVFLIIGGMDSRGHWRVAFALLILISGSTLIGLFQFAGSALDNPFINDMRGLVSATFANRNHFALFLAIGCVLSPVLAFRDNRRRNWVDGLSFSLVLPFLLMALATGSRSGAVLAIFGLSAGAWSVRRAVRREFRALPKRIALPVAVAVIATLVAVIIASIAEGRAVSLDRAMSLSISQDLRRAALPTVWAMTLHFFPVGTGFGTFDQAYRIFEPNELLGPRYFNHAHNDLLEVLLEGGVAAAVLLLAAVAWWFWRSIRVWRSDSSQATLAKAGSMILLLIFLASLTDYPARTPMVMALIVISAVWLETGRAVAKRSMPGRAVHGNRQRPEH